MKSTVRTPIHLMALIRRYSLIQLTRGVRIWEKRSLTQRKRDVLLLFGSLLLAMLANVSRHLPQNDVVTSERLKISPTDSAAHRRLYTNELQNRKPTQSR